MSRRSWFVSVVAVAFLSVLAAPGVAEEEGEGERLSKLSIHGFLTQAYGLAYDNQYAGIPTDSGTSDLRKAALQFRYDATPRDVIVLQLQHQRWGRTTSEDLQNVDDVSVDWAFYQHTFANDLWVRAGKVTIPFGVFNQVRDVGTILPFYRIPTTVYRDGALQIETVDGFAAGKTFSLGAVDLETATYYGETRLDAGAFSADLRNMIGGQVALVAFDSRLRASVSYYQGDGVQDSAPNVEEDWSAPLYSLDLRLGRVRLIGEWVDYKHDPVKTGGQYALVSVAATDKLTVSGMYQKDDFHFGGFHLDDFEEDTAVSLAWAFRPDLVLRLEHHLYEGFGVEFPAGVIPDGPGPWKGDHSILSLSASF